MAADGVEKVWDMMEKTSTCMLASWDGKELHSRPMAAYLRKEERTVYFLTDAHAHKDEDIEKYPQINLSFVSGNNYVSVSGHAVVSNDRFKIKELFGTAAKAWWNSPDDQNIRVLKFSPEEAQYWDSPNSVVAAIKMAAAAVSNTRPEMGDNKKVAMR